MTDLPDTPTPAARGLGEIIDALLALIDTVPPAVAPIAARAEGLRDRYDRMYRHLLFGGEP